MAAVCEIGIELKESKEIKQDTKSTIKELKVDYDEFLNLAAISFEQQTVFTKILPTGEKITTLLKNASIGRITIQQSIFAICWQINNLKKSANNKHDPKHKYSASYYKNIESIIPAIYEVYKWYANLPPNLQSLDRIPNMKACICSDYKPMLGKTDSACEAHKYVLPSKSINPYMRVGATKLHVLVGIFVMGMERWMWAFHRDDKNDFRKLSAKMPVVNWHHRPLSDFGYEDHFDKAVKLTHFFAGDSEMTPAVEMIKLAHNTAIGVYKKK